MKTDLRKIWEAQALAIGNEIHRERIPDLSDLICYVGMIGRTGARIFQLETELSVSVQTAHIRQFKGVEIQLLPADEHHQQFTIILLDNELTDIFILFIEDLIEKLKIASDSSEALTIIWNRINYWRQLFAKMSGELLSPERQRGLFGELFFLRKLLTYIDKSTALNAWQGSDGANQDFISNEKAIEIKTSKATNPFIHISNEHQLDYTCMNQLFLGVISVQESPGNFQTLHTLITGINELLSKSSDLKELFERKLIQAGINRETHEDYNVTSYNVRHCHFFKVGKGFPLLIRATVPDLAVHHFSYEIDFSACLPFEMEEETVLRTFL